jgi:hypothetical protein
MVNRKGERFRDASQVEAHIDGSHDGAHREERGGDHREQIEENAEEAGEFDLEPEESSGLERSSSDGPVEVAVAVDDDGEVVTEEMDVRAAFDVVSHMAVEPEGSVEMMETAFTMVEEVREENQELRDRLTEKEDQVAELYRAVEELAEQSGGMFGSAEVSFRHR